MKELIELRQHLFSLVTDENLPDWACKSLMLLANTHGGESWSDNYRSGVINRIFHRWCYDSPGTLTFVLHENARDHTSQHEADKTEFECRIIQTLQWLVDTGS